MAHYDADAYHEYSNGKNPFAMACVVLGSVSALTFSAILPAIVAGSLSILFGTLSRKGTGKLHPLATSGMFCAIVSLVLGLLMAVFYYITMFSSENIVFL